MIRHYGAPIGDSSTKETSAVCYCFYWNMLAPCSQTVNKSDWEDWLWSKTHLYRIVTRFLDCRSLSAKLIILWSGWIVRRKHITNHIVYDWWWLHIKTNRCCIENAQFKVSIDMGNIASLIWRQFEARIWTTYFPSNYIPWTAHF